jgi:hypothetical protein
MGASEWVDEVEANPPNALRAKGVEKEEEAHRVQNGFGAH